VVTGPSRQVRHGGGELAAGGDATVDELVELVRGDAAFQVGGHLAADLGQPVVGHVHERLGPEPVVVPGVAEGVQAGHVLDAEPVRRDGAHLEHLPGGAAAEEPDEALVPAAHQVAVGVLGHRVPPVGQHGGDQLAGQRS
jgi:hypothetical protein